MKFFYTILIFYSGFLLAQSSPGMKEMQLEQKRLYEEQLRYQQEMDSMRQKDVYLKALDSTLQGMEKISADRTAKSKAKVTETLSRLKIGRGQYKVFIYDYTKMKRHEFTMPLGGKDERYSCFITKKSPKSFHTVARDEKIMSEIKFDITNIGLKDEKLAIFVKGRNIEASFEVPKTQFRRSTNFRDGFIKLNTDLKSTNDPKLILKNNTEVSFNVCGEADLEGMPSSGDGQQGY